MLQDPPAADSGRLNLQRRRRRRRAGSDCPAEDHLADQLGHVRERAQEFLERELLFGVNEDRWTEREKLLRHALSPRAQRDERASVFVNIRSSSIVAIGMALALFTIGTTIVCSLIWRCTDEQRREANLDNLHSETALKFLADPYCADLQGLVYPYISETARDMPQTGFFAFGMTISVMMMVCCAILQYGKVKRDIRNGNHGIPVGAKRNFVALICGLVAPPFLGLLACYDTRRALNTHRACVVIFFGLTVVYMFTMLSIYSYLAQIDDHPEFGSPVASPSMLSRPVAKRALGGSQSFGPGDDNTDMGDAEDVEFEQTHPHHDVLKPDVHFSLSLKTYIATTFTVLTTFYLPVGFM